MFSYGFYFVKVDVDILQSYYALDDFLMRSKLCGFETILLYALKCMILWLWDAESREWIAKVITVILKSSRSYFKSLIFEIILLLFLL